MRSFTQKATAALVAAALLVPMASVRIYAEPDVSVLDEAVLTDNGTDSAYDNIVTFSDTGITSENDTGIIIEGTELTVNAAGTYKLTGSCSDGSVKVKKGTTGVTLILSDLSLASTTTAPVSVNKGAEAVIVIEGNNTVTDKEDPANETSEDAEIADAFEGAAIKVKSGAKLTVTGTGTLTLNGSACKNGLKGGSEAEVTVGETASDTFTLNINAKKNALACDGRLTVNGGILNVTSVEDGLKASPDDDDTVSAGEVVINGGTLNINVGEDGIQGDSLVSVIGGTLNISAGDDAIHSEYALNIGEQGSTTGPVINITNAYEGIEGAVINFYSGSGTIVTSEDGVNAANGDLENYAFQLNIYSGTWLVDAGGDGLDSNGDLNVCGGYTEVFGSAQNDNAALDYGDNNNKFVFTGGTIVGIGTGNMANVPTSGDYISFGQGGMGGGPGGGQPGEPGGGDPPGQPGGGQPGEPGSGQPGEPGGGQPGGQTGTAITIPAGASIVIKDSSGSTIYSTTARKAASHITYASDTLVSGETYTLYINGTAAATSTVGGNNNTPQPFGGDIIEVGSGKTLSDAVAEITTAVKNGTAQPSYTIKLTGDVTETKSFTLPDVPITITSDTPSTLTLKGATLTAKNSLTLENVTLTNGKKNVAVTAKKDFTARNCVLGAVKVTGHADIIGCTINGALTLSDKTAATMISGSAVTGKITAAGDLVLENCSSVSAIAAKGSLTINGDPQAATAAGAITVTCGTGVTTLNNVTIAKGNVKTSNELVMNGCSVTGNVTSAGAARLENSSVIGNVTVTGNATLDGAFIFGKLTVKSDLYINGSSTVAGAVSAAGITSDDDANVLSYTALSVTKNGVLAGSKKLTLCVVTITDKKLHTFVSATLDPASKKANTAVKTFKGNFPTDTLYISADNCANAKLVQSGTKLIVSE